MQEQTFINFVGHFAPVIVLYMFCNAKLASECFVTHSYFMDGLIL